MAAVTAELWWRAYAWTIIFLSIALVATIAWVAAYFATRRKPFLAFGAGFGVNAVSGAIQVAIDFIFLIPTRLDAGVPMEAVLAEQQAWAILFQVLYAVFYGAVILAAVLFWREGKGRKRGKPGETPADEKVGELEW